MGIAVALMPDPGAPQVGVTVTGLNAVTPSTISVQVSSNGGKTYQTVRGADHLTVTSAMFVRDFVPPLNVPATYQLVVHSGATIPTPLTATITVPSSTAWIQDPLYPALAVPIECLPVGVGALVLANSFASLTRDQQFDAVTVTGARYPVASVGIRQVPSRVPLHLRTRPGTPASIAADLRNLFDLSGVLVLRGLPAAIPLDAVAHVVVGAIEENPVVGDVLGERNDWSLTVTQVRATSAAIVVPWYTYATVFTAWAPATYADAMAARPGQTYLDWLRDPRKV
jgi:hypothetical protein